MFLLNKGLECVLHNLHSRRDTGIQFTCQSANIYTAICCLLIFTFDVDVLYRSNKYHNIWMILPVTNDDHWPENKLKSLVVEAVVFCCCLELKISSCWN